MLYFYNPIIRIVRRRNKFFTYSFGKSFFIQSIFPVMGNEKSTIFWFFHTLRFLWFFGLFFFTKKNKKNKKNF